MTTADTTETRWDTATLWNALYPVGTRVLAWPHTLNDPPLSTTTRSRAWPLGHGEPVVLVDGVSGGISLEHIQPLDRTGPLPVRVERRRDKGWRKPPGAVYVGRGTRWGNPYKVGETLVRSPGITGKAWELEGRIGKAPGQRHHFVHPGGTVTWHQVEHASPEQVVQLYREWIAQRPELVAAAKLKLADRHLMCWCPTSAPCHADVLLLLANTPA